MSRLPVRALLGALLALVIVPLAAIPAHAAGTYTLQGKVTGTDANGNDIPLVNVPVVADDYGSGGNDWAETFTDSDGSYELTADDGVTGPGPWEIETSCDDGDACYDTYPDTYAPTSYGPNGSPTQVPLTSGTPATVNLEMQRWGTIQGTITDTDGKPVTTQLDWSGIYDGAGETTDQPSGPDADGHYTITHVRPGEDLSFNVSDPSKKYSTYSISPFTVAQGPTVTTQDIVMNPWSQITETVTDTSGNPLPGVIWDVWEQQSDGTWFDQEYGPRPLDDQGRYTLPTQVGHHYKICAYDDDYSSDYQPTVRYRTTCWPDATTEADAEVWTPTVASPTLDATVAMPVAGKSLTPADPWVSGTPDVGKTLTVDPGVWGPGDVSLSYQWAYDDEGDLGVTDFKFYKPIPGATASTYSPTADMAGRSIEVEVTGTEAGYAAATVQAIAGKVGATRPALTTPLTITGSTAVGSTLTASYGWDDTGTGAWSTLAWAVDGITQPGDATTLTITPAMAGKTISARLDVGDSEKYDDELRASASVTVDGVTAGTVAITGTPTVGQALTATASAWRPAGVGLTYQWYADGTAIAGATASTLPLTAAQAGKTITVTATGTRTGSSAAATSAATATVAAATMTPGAVTVTGTLTVGQTLTADPGTWTPSTAILAYQWYADGTPIPDATASTLPLTADQAGKTVTVTVTGTAVGYTTMQATSDPTAAVVDTSTPPLGTDTPSPPSTTAPTTTTPYQVAVPTLSGRARVGEKLTAQVGGPPAGAKVTFQWYRNGKKVKHATKRKYKLTKKDRGKRITVKVTVSAPGATTTTGTSKTVKVKAAKEGGKTKHRAAVRMPGRLSVVGDS